MKIYKKQQVSVRKKNEEEEKEKHIHTNLVNWINIWMNAETRKEKKLTSQWIFSFFFLTRKKKQA